MAPLQGSRLGEAETEGLLHGFDHIAQTVFSISLYGAATRRTVAAIGGTEDKSQSKSVLHGADE